MADAVADAIENRHHLVVEAGTGVGKSFAYLVPAILATGEKKQNGGDDEDDAPPRRVVISTHTISLQEQLLDEGHPALAERDAGRVLRRAGQGPAELPQPAADEKRPGPGRGPVQRGRRVRAAPPDRGLVAQTRPTARSPICPSSRRPRCGTKWPATTNCMGRECPTYAACFYYQARRRMSHAQILVVNHALFFTDLALRHARRGHVAQARHRDLRRGPHAGGRGRRPPGPAAHQRPGRVHPAAALQRPDEQGPAGPARLPRGPRAGDRLLSPRAAFLRRHRPSGWPGRRAATAACGSRRSSRMR